MPAVPTHCMGFAPRLLIYEAIDFDDNNLLIEPFSTVFHMHIRIDKISTNIVYTKFPHQAVGSGDL